MSITHHQGLAVGARRFPGNPFDGYTLAAQLEQTTTLLQDIGVAPKVAVVDLGYRGMDAAVTPVQRQGQAPDQAAASLAAPAPSH